jgi:hypothetical protein
VARFFFGECCIVEDFGCFCVNKLSGEYCLINLFVGLKYLEIIYFQFFGYSFRCISYVVPICMLTDFYDYGTVDRQERNEGYFRKNRKFSNHDFFLPFVANIYWRWCIGQSTLFKSYKLRPIIPNRFTSTHATPLRKVEHIDDFY